MKLRVTASLFLSCALLCCLPLQAQGPSDPNGTPQTPAQQKLSTSDTVTVTASGATRDEQSISQTLLQEVSPGTSPIAVLGRLPSVEVTKSDPFGAYEWALRINVRGFNQNQLGFTLDDVPLGDMSYGNLNGLHISRAIIDENLGGVTMSQGTGSLAVASNSNLGATVGFFSSSASDTMKFDARQTFGSFADTRTFARFDSGKLRWGSKFYIAGVYQAANKWKSEGEINQHYYQFNGKLEQPLGSKGMFTYFIDYSNRAEVDYQDLNKVWVQKLGYNWDNFGDWSKSIQAANAYNSQGKTGFALYPGVSTNFPNPVASLQSGVGDLSNDPEDAGYFGASGLRKDLLTYASVKYAFTPKLSLSVTGYGHRDNGRGLWFQPYLPTFDATGTQVSPISLRTSEYGIARGGVVATVTYDMGRNQIEGGGWYEKETFDLARKFYATSLFEPMHSLYEFPKNPFYTQWAYTFPEYVYQFHLQDTYHFNDKLTLQAGFKSINTSLDGKLAQFNTGLNLNPAATAANFAQGTLKSGKPFLPQVGADYKLDKHNELFTDVAWNVRAYQAGGNGFGTAPWGTTQAGFNQLLANHLKPETAWSEELGYRYNGETVQGQASYFHVNYANRLLAIQQGAGAAGLASILANVGGVTTDGVDGAVNLRLPRHFTLYNAFTYVLSTYDANYQVQTAPGVFATIQTGGKVSVDTPKVLYKNELSYSLGAFEAHINSDFMGMRYFTYTNDNSVGSRIVADFGLSYHKDQVGKFDQFKVAFNAFNIQNNKYWDTIGTNGFVASDVTSVNNNTLQQGFPRAFSGSLTARF